MKGGLKMEETEIFTTVQITTGDRTRLNKVRGENDFKTYYQTINFLLNNYFRGQ